MRRDFARTVPWIAVMAIVCQGFVYADDISEGAISEAAIADSVTPTDRVVEEDTPLFRHSSYPAAWTAAQKSNRPILIYVSMPNCPYCVKMVKKTYELPEVESMVASSFEPIYAGRFTHAKLVKRLKVKFYPTTILVGPNNKVLDVIKGYVEPKAFQRRLQTGLAALSTPIKTR